MGAVGGIGAEREPLRLAVRGIGGGLGGGERAGCRLAGRVRLRRGPGRLIRGLGGGLIYFLDGRTLPAVWSAEFDPVEFSKWMAERNPVFMVPRFIEIYENGFPMTASQKIKVAEIKEITDRTWDRQKAGLKFRAR